MKKLLLLLTLALASLTASAQRFTLDGLAVINDGKLSHVDQPAEVEITDNGLILRSHGAEVTIILKDSTSDSSYTTPSGQVIFVYEATDGVSDCRLHRLDFKGGIKIAIELDGDFILFEILAGNMIKPEGV